MKKHTFIDGVNRPLVSRAEIDARFAGGWKLRKWKFLARLQRIKEGVAHMFSAL